MQGTNVTLRTLTLFLWVCLIATAAVAGEEQRTHIKIAVAGDGQYTQHGLFLRMHMATAIGAGRLIADHFCIPQQALTVCTTEHA